VASINNRGFANLLILPLVALIIAGFFVLFQSKFKNTTSESLGKITPQIKNEVSLSIIGSELLAEGKVTSKEQDPYSNDSQSSLDLTLTSGQLVKVIIPSKDSLCDAKGIMDSYNLTRVNENVEVFGKITRKNEITLCDSQKYYLKILPS